MTDTEMKWRERVAGWRASGETAEAFAERSDFEPTTLRYWASRLKSRKTTATPPSAPRAVAMARVVRRREPASGIGRPSDDGDSLVITIGNVRIVVGRNFDPAVLRDVVAALGGGK